MTVKAQKAPFNLNMHTHRLLSDEPFFAALSRRIDKRASTSVPTAGVRVTDDGRFEMLYNPEFMERMIEECGKSQIRIMVLIPRFGIFLRRFFVM